MRILCQLLACISTSLLPVDALAGSLYGTVRTESGRPPERAQVELACPRFGSAASSAESNIDSSGSFALRVNANGRCEMRVRRGNQIGAAFNVFVSNNPNRFDFVVGQDLARLR